MLMMSIIYIINIYKHIKISISIEKYIFWIYNQSIASRRSDTMQKISLKKIALICKTYRKDKDFNQNQMADILSINPQIYGKIEREQHLPKLDQIENILQVTQSTFDSILEDNKPDVFIALKGEAKTENEKQIIDEMIEMILCLDKHKNIMESYHE